MSRRGIILCLKLAITAAAIVFLFASQKLRLSQLNIAPEGWYWIPLAGLLVLLQMGLAQVRLWLLMRASGVDIGLARVVRIGLISWFLNASLFGGLGFLSGDAIRAAYFMRESDKTAPIVGTILFDRVVGLVALLMLAAFSLAAGLRADLHTAGLGLIPLLVYGLLAFVGLAIMLMIVAQLFSRWAAAVVAIAVCIVAAIAVQMALSTGAGFWTGLLVLLSLGAATPSLVRRSILTRLADRSPRIGGFLAGTLVTMADYRKKAGTLLLAYINALVSHGLSILALFVLAQGITIGLQPSFLQVLFAAPVAFLTAILPLPANGLGVGEIAFDSMLRLLQSPGAGALGGGAALYLSYRILVTIMALAGLPYFLQARKSGKVAGET